MTPAEYGFAVGQQMAATGDKYLMGIRTGQAQQELSLRQKAFQAEQDWNNRRYPLMEKQLGIQADALRIQQQQQQTALDMQNANMRATAEIAPHLAELDVIARAGDAGKLSSYQIPDIRVETGNPLIDSYASTLARQGVAKYQKQLLENNQIYKTWGDAADKALSVANRYDTPTPIKMQLQDMALRLRSGGLNSLTDFEKYTLLPYADKTAYAYSPERIAMLKLQQDLESKQEGAQTKRIEALGKVAGNIFVTPEVQQATSEELTKMLKPSKGKPTTSGGVIPEEPSMPSASVTKPSEKDLNMFATNFRQGASAIRSGTSALDVINELSDNLLKTYGKPITAKNKLAAQIQVLNLMRANGIDLPFTEEDLSSTSQTEE
jgi:hypothetical protein